VDRGAEPGSRYDGGGAMSRPASTAELLPSERMFVAAMSSVGFGRFEYLRIERGELALDPWPAVVRDVKFCSHDPGTSKTPTADFELKPQVAELFEYIRDVDAGEIRTLEVKSGLPFSMEIEMAGGRRNG
jgi:hypothetical protein